MKKEKALRKKMPNPERVQKSKLLGEELIRLHCPIT
jgi:hypothetical protein